MDTGPERAETVGRRRTCTRPRSPFTLPRWGHQPNFLRAFQAPDFESRPRPRRTTPAPHPDPLRRLLSPGAHFTSRSIRMHPTAGQLSGRHSAGSSRFAKSVASTIAMSDGRPERAQSVRHAPARPSVRLLGRPHLSSTSFRGGRMGPKRAQLPCLRPAVYRLLAFLGVSREHRPSSTELDEVLANGNHEARSCGGFSEQ